LQHEQIKEGHKEKEERSVEEEKKIKGREGGCKKEGQGERSRRRGGINKERQRKASSQERTEGKKKFSTAGGARDCKRNGKKKGIAQKHLGENNKTTGK